MNYAELKEALRAYIDEISGEEPSERDIEILGYLDDYTEPEAVTEEEITARINDAVTASDASWRKKFKDRFYGRDADPEEPEKVTEPEVVTNEPEQEEFKSVLDYEW